MTTRNSRAPGGRTNKTRKSPKEPTPSAPSWMTLEEPAVRTLRVYALDPSADNFIGNIMSVNIKWEKNLKQGPVGSKIAVIDYDGANQQYYRLCCKKYFGHN
jgi:hypothetical protein